MSELKPCPFCGRRPYVANESYRYDGGELWTYYSADVVCAACDVTMHVSNPHAEMTDSAHALDFLIDAWNRRAEQ